MRTPSLWITYAWADNSEGDFDYLVGALQAAGIRARYDRVALVAGRRLWDQIGAEITSGSLSGWAYLLTPRSLASEACREELAYALQRALATKGADFPLLGLLSGVAINDVPPALAVRLCVDLRTPDWIEQIRSSLKNRPPSRHVDETPNFKGRPHNRYLGKADLRAVEFLPRFGELRYWRIAFPTDGPQPVMKGTGPAGGCGVGPILHAAVEGTVEIGGMHMNFFGAGDALTPANSAYIVFEQRFPVHMAFGWAEEPFGSPAEWWPVKLA
jgi:hypothetical protein